MDEAVRISTHLAHVKITFGAFPITVIQETPAVRMCARVCA